jgi:hypothetical protein
MTIRLRCAVCGGTGFRPVIEIPSEQTLSEGVLATPENAKDFVLSPGREVCVGCGAVRPAALSERIHPDLKHRDW